MLKYLKFSGVYHDESLSVHVTLENPLDYDLEAASLTFSVMVSARNSSVIVPELDSFTFYIMDEANRLFNTQSVTTPTIEADTDNDKPVSRSEWLILTDFQLHFLYQDLRVAFYYQPYQTIRIIKLRH